MDIVDLMAEVGSENITFQVLKHSTSGAKLRKGGVTEISFHTDAISVPAACGITEAPVVGLVVWLPRDKLPERFKKL